MISIPRLISKHWPTLLVGAVALGAWSTSSQAAAQLDFAVFWSGGARFMSGESLYPAVAIDITFLYPPFAAWLFQALALLPLDNAYRAFALVNAVLYLGAMWLTAAALGKAYPESRWRAAFIVGVIFSFPFVQWNFVWGQVNLLILVLVLGAVVSVQRDRAVLAGALVAVAAGIKVMPVLFAVWLVLRVGRRATLGLVLGSVLVVLLPVVWRGVPQGVADLAEFVDSVLRGFLAGGVRVRADNYNLATLVYGLLGPVPASGTFQVPYYAVDAGEAVRAAVYRLLALAALGGWAAVLVVRWRRDTEWSLVEVTATFLLSALISGVTWHHHLVALLFVVAVLLVELGRQSTDRWLLGTASVMLLVGSVGRDVLGSLLYDQLQQLHLLRIGLVVAFVWSLVALGRPTPDEVVSGS